MKKRVNDWLRDGMLRRLGVDKPPLLPPIDTIRRTESCPEFERLRSNRMVMGYFRYGPIAEQPRGRFDYADNIIKRAEEYARTKNKEYLVDIANISMIAFMVDEGHFTPVDDGIHNPELSEQ